MGFTVFSSSVYEKFSTIVLFSNAAFTVFLCSVFLDKGEIFIAPGASTNGMESVMCDPCTANARQ